MSDKQLVRHEVKTFLLAYKCPACDKAELVCVGLDVNNPSLPWKHSCPNCLNIVHMDKQYPALAYERI
jgi:hypothetical protein